MISTEPVIRPRENKGEQGEDKPDVGDLHLSIIILATFLIIAIGALTVIGFHAFVKDIARGVAREEINRHFGE